MKFYSLILLCSSLLLVSCGETKPTQDDNLPIENPEGIEDSNQTQRFNQLPKEITDFGSQNEPAPQIDYSQTPSIEVEATIMQDDFPIITESNILD